MPVVRSDVFEVVAYWRLLGSDGNGNENIAKQTLKKTDQIKAGMNYHFKFIPVMK